MKVIGNTDTIATVVQRQQQKIGCTALDGTSVIVMMLAAIGAMLAGSVGMLRHTTGDRATYIAHLTLTVVGMASGIAAAGALGSMTG